MQDYFTKYVTTPHSAATRAENIIPSDENLSFLTRGIYIGDSGDLQVIMMDSDIPITFTGIQGGSLMPIRVKKILPATTAANIVILT